MKEQEIIERLRVENETFRKLIEEHRSLENVLEEIDKKRYLTAEEQIERKKVQKQKLLKKDKMAELIRDFKKTHASN